MAQAAITHQAYHTFCCIHASGLSHILLQMARCLQQMLMTVFQSLRLQPGCMSGKQKML